MVSLPPVYHTVCTMCYTYRLIAAAIYSQISRLYQSSHSEVYSLRFRMVLDDFELAVQGLQGQTGPAASGEKPKDPKKREWLRVYETAPAQLLNVYGPS